MTQQHSWSDLNIDIPHGRTSGEVDALCPWCSHTRQHHRWEKCLSVNLDKESYICHHCGESGGLGGSHTMSAPQPEYGAPLAKREYARPEPPPIQDDQQPLYDYFAKRGISQHTVKRNRVVLGETWSETEGRSIPAISFQYFRRGELINIKHRAMDKKSFRLVKDAERILYGYDDIKDARVIIIVEGEIDKLSLEEAGYTNVVSVPDGAPAVNTKSVGTKLDYFNEPSKTFDDASQIVFAVDNDAPGEKLIEFMLGRFKLGKCARVHWPEGCKDANDVLVKHGDQELTRCIENAEPYPVTGLFHVREQMDKVYNMYENGLPNGFSTGMRNLDVVYRPLKGTMTIVTGSPSAGKSHFLDNLVVRMAHVHDWRFAFYSPENYPLHYHISRLLGIRYKKPFGRGTVNRITPEEVEDGLWWLHDHVGFIMPDQPDIDAILERAYAMRSRMGINGLVLDPWNEIDRSMDKGFNETQYTSKVLGDIRDFARDTDVHVWIVAHPTKLQKDKDGNYPCPTPYDISGSAHFYNKADQCLSVHRDQAISDDPVGVHVQKMRFSNAGQRGVAWFSFDYHTGIFKPSGYQLANGTEEFYGDDTSQ